MDFFLNLREIFQSPGQKWVLEIDSIFEAMVEP